MNGIRIGNALIFFSLLLHCGNSFTNEEPQGFWSNLQARWHRLTSNTADTLTEARKKAYAAIQYGKKFFWQGTPERTVQRVQEPLVKSASTVGLSRLGTTSLATLGTYVPSVESTGIPKLLMETTPRISVAAGGVPLAIAGARQIKYGISQKDTVLALMGSAILSSGLGLIYGASSGQLTPEQVQSILTMSSVITALHIATIVVQKLYAYVMSEEIAEDEGIKWAKMIYERALNESDAFPTTQMQLNEIIRLLINLNQESSKEAQFKITALELLKKEKQKKMITWNEFCSKNDCSLQALKNKLKEAETANEIDTVALIKEMIINAYILKIFQDIQNDQNKIYTNYNSLWDLLKTELSLSVKRLEATREEWKSLEPQLDLIQSNPEYKAFKSVLKSLRQKEDITLTVLLYEHEYIKVKDNEELFKTWRENASNDNYYSFNFFTAALTNVEKRVLMQELETNENKVEILHKLMETSDWRDPKYQAAESILKDLGQ